MTYEFTTTAGDVLATISNFESDQDAITEAKTRLEDDPELGEVLVFKDTCFLGRATHVPDSDWQSMVAWLWDGEQVLPPAGTSVPAFFACDPDESCGYDLSDPKHPRHHDVFSGLSDDR